jgi:hypothetical protein
MIARAGLWAAILIAALLAPFVGVPAAYSGLQWAFTPAPAGCFASSQTSIPSLGIIFPEFCTDWRTVPLEQRVRQAAPIWDFPDVKIEVSPSLCADKSQDASAGLNAIIVAAARLQQSISPSSLAAAMSTEGATVQVRFPPVDCIVSNPVIVPADARLWLHGLHLVGDLNNPPPYLLSLGIPN